MNMRRRHLVLPALTGLGSLLLMLLLASLTSPVKNIAFAIVLFVALLIFMISLGYLAVLLQTGQINPKNRYRISILSLLILIAVMLRSAQSLNLIDAAVLTLIAFGLLFYSGRRSF